MTTAQIIEVAFAAALIVASIVLYRRRGREDARQGSQGAVLLFVMVFAASAVALRVMRRDAVEM